MSAIFLFFVLACQVGGTEEKDFCPPSSGGVQCHNLVQKATHIEQKALNAAPEDDDLTPRDQSKSKQDKSGKSKDEGIAATSPNRTATEGKAEEQRLDQRAMLKLLLCGLAATVFITIAATVAAVFHRQALPAAREGLTSPVAAMRGSSKPLGPQVGPPLPEATVAAGLVPLFESNALKSPSAACLLDAETGACVSYQQVQALSSCLAADLRRLELGDGDVAALLFEPSRRLVVAMLGCMQARVCWVPLDLKSPRARLRHLLDRAGCALGLAADGWTVDTVAPLPVWLLNDAGEAIKKPKPRLPVAGTPRATGNACIFFTSGSTGDPKPVMYSHAFLCHCALCAARLCSADSRTVFLIKTPTVWAVIAYEVLSPLTVGARSVVDARAQRDVVRLQRTITEHGVNILITSAPVLQLLADERLPSLRHAINIGAGLPLEICRSVQSSFGRSLSIHNMYGCTETPCLQWTYDPSMLLPGKTVAPAGVPQPAVEVHLLDTDLQPVPEGNLGEIWIGGPYLSSGYLGDEKMTEARYVRTPNGKYLMYKTGDTGRWIREATKTVILHVEGRIDRQLNINGVRVAPEEVEAVLSQAPGLKEVAVVVAGVGGKEKMVAWASGEHEAGLKEAIHSHCLEHLPLHMRPSTVLLMPHLPRLSNGKVDLIQLARKAEAEMPTDDEEEVSTVDSLGRMKVVKRQALHENKVMSAARCIAACSLLLYHWYFVRYAWFDRWVSSDMQSEWHKQGPVWFTDMVGGMVGVSGWSMNIFITVSGYDDAREASRSTVQRNILAIVLFFFAYIMPACYKFILYDVFQSREWRVCYEDASPRWYFVYYVLCNLLHSLVYLPLRTAAEKVSPFMTLLAGVSCLSVVTALCCAGTRDWWTLWNETLFLNPCKDGAAKDWPHWVHTIASLLIADFYPRLNSCNFIRPNYLFLFLHYSMAWWLGPPLVARLQKGFVAKALTCVGSLPWVAAFVGVSSYLGYVFSNCDKTEHQCFYPSIFGNDTWALTCFMNPLSAYLLLMALALVSHRKWFPLSTLAWLGNFSLAVYIFHYHFAVWNVDDEKASMRFFTLYNNITLVPPPEDIVTAVGDWPGSSLARLAVLIIYPLVWTATLGRFFQGMLLGAFSLSRKAMNVVL